MELLVPATTTNFGAGFDTFGLALNLYNYFHVEENDRFLIEIEGEGKDLPRDESNLVVKVYKRVCEVKKREVKPFFLKQKNEVPTSRGLGSSATAIVGGLMIFERLTGEELSLEEKLKIAYEFEPHPDNLIPALVGGFVICLGGYSFHRTDFPKDISLVFAVPDFELSTQKAREVLRKEVPLEDAVFNIRRASLFIASILSRNYELLREATRDRLHQPFRAELVKGFKKVVETALEAGALGVFLSGAGPTICALCGRDSEESVGKAMEEAFRSEGVKARVLSLRASDRGAYWRS